MTTLTEDPVDPSVGGDERQQIVEEMERKLQDNMRSSGTPTSELRKTMDEVFDESTLLTLYKMMTEGVIDTVDYPVSTGKEANVFHASAPGGGPLALKIFRVNTATFRSFMRYIRGDPRFDDVGPERRDVVHAWTRKEHRNLAAARSAGAPVPRPLAFRDNVLAMSFVGAEGTPAPRLTDHPSEDPEEAFDRIADAYAAVLGAEELVHGDLSEYNVLHCPGEPPERRFVLIDWAQAVVLDHPMSGELLERDAENLSSYLRRRGAECTREDALERFTEELDDDAVLDEVIP